MTKIKFSHVINTRRLLVGFPTNGHPSQDLLISFQVCARLRLAPKPWHFHSQLMMGPRGDGRALSESSTRMVVFPRHPGSLAFYIAFLVGSVFFSPSFFSLLNPLKVKHFSRGSVWRAEEALRGHVKIRSLEERPRRDVVSNSFGVVFPGLTGVFIRHVCPSLE